MKYAIILLDIDQTIAVCNTANPHKHELTWIGGIETWQETLKQFHDKALLVGIKILYGIATLKAYPGDYVSSLVRGDMKFDFRNSLKVERILDRRLSSAELNGLKNLLHQELIFFVGQAYQCIQDNMDKAESILEHQELLADAARCKADFALAPAKQRMEFRYLTSIPNKNIWLIDDQSVICQETAKTYSAIDVSDLLTLEPEAQKNRIKDIFSEAFLTEILKIAAQAPETNLAANSDNFFNLHSFTRPIVIPKLQRKISFLDLDSDEDIIEQNSGTATAQESSAPKTLPRLGTRRLG